MTVSDSLHNTDNDVIKGMNLLRWPKTFAMAYPDYWVVNDSLKHHRPAVITVADSFWWYIYSSNIPNATYGDHHFWYYNETIYPESFYSPTNVKDIDYFKKIRDADVLIILHSESTLARFGCGFIEMAYETYCAPGLYKQKLQNVKAVIRNTEAWYKDVIRKAAERNISADSMLTIDAIYTMKETGY
jgi:hypothetical protein